MAHPRLSQLPVAHDAANSAERLTLYTASPIETCFGSARRASSVLSSTAGTATTARISEGSGGIRTYFRSVPSQQLTTIPPRQQGTTLSGCPSIETISGSSSSFGSGRSRSSFAIATPPTMAEDELPSPRFRGMAFIVRSRRPGGSTPHSLHALS